MDCKKKEARTLPLELLHTRTIWIQSPVADPGDQCIWMGAYSWNPPLLWVGTPPFKLTGSATDPQHQGFMLYLKLLTFHWKCGRREHFYHIILFKISFAAKIHKNTYMFWQYCIKITSKEIIALNYNPLINIKGKLIVICNSHLFVVNRS